MDNPPQDRFEQSIKQQWMRNNLQMYALICRLKTDSKFRKEWIARRIQKEDLQSHHGAQQLLSDFIKALELVPTVNICGRPVIRITPRRFRGKSCQGLLDLKLKHTTTCLNLLLDDAVGKIIAGYAIVQVLGSVFGDEYKEMVTRYVVKKMQEELKPKNE